MNKFKDMPFEEVNEMVNCGISDEDELLLCGAGFKAVSPRENLCAKCARYFDCYLEVDCSYNGLIVTACPWHYDSTKEMEK